MKTGILWRSWYYFRFGYNNVLSYPRSLFITMAGFYLILVEMFSQLRGELLLMAIIQGLGISIGAVICILSGWFYLKKTNLWTSEIDVNVEANPYNWMLPPGYWRDAILPVYLHLMKNCNWRDLELEKKLELLISGKSLGKRISKF